jgi:formyltetrahydrofolate-dependent phosphoribosylglycinamide formyltransferase
VSKARVAILISGRGSNMIALLDAMQADDFPARPVLVLSNDPGAAGLAAAAARGVPTAAVSHRAFKAKAEFEAALDAALAVAQVDIVCLAGFMRVLSPAFTERWEGRLLNIHPSLLPSFPGLDTHARALEAGVALHGCSVHLVSAEVDAGRILGQTAVPVLPGDGEATLAARVLVQEHRLYAACLRAHLENKAARPPGTARLANPSVD